MRIRLGGKKEIEEIYKAAIWLMVFGLFVGVLFTILR
jgi:hypothetical protein